MLKVVAIIDDTLAHSALTWNRIDLLNAVFCPGPFSPEGRFLLRAVYSRGPFWDDTLLVSHICYRWSVVSQAYDDRTSVERGTAPDVDGRRPPVARRRWSSINCYLSQKGSAHNDVPIIHDQETVQQLIGGEI